MSTALSAPSVAWRDALSGFKVFGSQTPAAFSTKREHFPDDVATRTCGVFVDVLRATTTLVAVASAGCKGIYVDVKPDVGEYPFIPPQLKAHHEGTWVFGGELNGLPIKGIDALGQSLTGAIGNSPVAVKPHVFKDQLLRFFSTNGSRALRSVMAANLRSIHAMCIANIDATVHSILRRRPERVWLVCGGFYGSASLEDSVACGIAISRLLAHGFAEESDLDDEAQSMLYLARQFIRDGRLASTELIARLRDGQVGRLLTSMGRMADITACVSGVGMQGFLWRDMSSMRLTLASSREPFLVPEDLEVFQ